MGVPQNSPGVGAGSEHAASPESSGSARVQGVPRAVSRENPDISPLGRLFEVSLPGAAEERRGKAGVMPGYPLLCDGERYRLLLGLPSPAQAKRLHPGGPA